MNTLRLFALSLVTAGLFAGSILADDTKPAGETKSAPAVTKAPEVTQPNRLEKLLKETGIPFEKKVDEKSKVTYFVVKEYGPENYYFEIEETRNTHYTWVTFPCGKAPEAGIPAEIMEKLLTENTKMGTSFFQYSPKTKMICLKMPLASAALDAKLLKADIHWLLKDANRTRNLWDSNQWSKSAGNN